MTYYYSPHTREHIATDEPADWMGSTAIAPPAFDPATQGVFFKLGAWVVVTNPAPVQEVPQSVTMRQARLALLAVGKLAGVSTAINALAEPQKSEALIEWEFSSVVMREKPFVVMLGAALGLDAAALDALFISAAAL